MNLAKFESQINTNNNKIQIKNMVEVSPSSILVMANIHMLSSQTLLINLTLIT